LFTFLILKTFFENAVFHEIPAAAAIAAIALRPQLRLRLRLRPKISAADRGTVCTTNIFGGHWTLNKDPLYRTPVCG